MQQIAWFERKFEFPKEQNIFPGTVERLADAPLRLEHKLRAYPDNILTRRLNDEWSIQEHLGHLIDLEPLWYGRLHDILDGEAYLREADLSNTKTHQAGHNLKSLESLLAEFSRLRGKTVERLWGLKEEEIFKSALHPRLHQPMRLMDLFIFVVEHDDHHLAQMTHLSRAFNANLHT